MLSVMISPRIYNTQDDVMQCMVDAWKLAVVIDAWMDLAI